MNEIQELKTQAEQAYHRGELRNALARYRRLARLRPEDADVLNDLGTVLFAAGNLEESHRCYRRALELEPGHAESRQNLEALCRAAGASTEVASRQETPREVTDAVIETERGELPAWSTVSAEAKRLLAADRPREAFREVLGFRIATGRSEAAEFIRRRFRGTRVHLTLVMDEGIGNMVMLTPAVRAIRQTLPRSVIEVVGTRPALDVVEGSALVDGCTAVEDYEQDGDRDALLLSAWSDRFAREHVRAAGSVGCPVCGVFNPFAGCRASEMFARRAGWPLRRPEEDARCHESALHVELARLLGFRGRTPRPDCAVERVELPFDGEGPVALLADTCAEGPAWQRKRWPHFPDLAARMLEEGYQVGVIGGETEAKRDDADRWPPGVVRLEGRYSVPQTAGLIRGADLLVANDSGPAHLGGAVGTETFVLFGPTRESKNRPLGERVHVLAGRAGCRPCQYLPSWKHCGRPRCLEMLPADYVLRAVETGGEALLPGEEPPEPPPHRDDDAVRVDLGCGLFKRRGFLGIDLDPQGAADVVCDVREGIPLADDSVDYVAADNLLEHIGDGLVEVMNEVWRVCRASGEVEVTVPVFPSEDAVSDPTHRRYFTEHTFRYLDRNSSQYRQYGLSYGFKPFEVVSTRRHAGTLEVLLRPYKGPVRSAGKEVLRAARPRVCFATHNQPLAGGGERALHQVANRLTRRGHRVQVIYNRTPFIHAREPEEPPDAAYEVTWVSGEDLESFHRAAADAVADRADEIDLCIPLWRANCRALLAACRENDVIVGTWCQNVNYPRDERSRRVFNESDFVVAVSPCIRELLKKRFRRTRDVFVIPNAAADVFFEHYRDRAGAGDSRLIFFGRLEFAQKGLDVLCRAVAALKEGGDEVSLDVVGDGPDAGLLRSAVGLLGLGGNVRLLGWKAAAELAGMLPRYDLCVLPSNFEGCSLAVIEAMATGTPVVSTAVGGTPWIVTHRKHGLLVPPARPEALAEAVRWAREHPSEMNLMGRWAHRRAAKRYHWNAVVTRYAKTLQDVFTRSAR